MYEVSGGYSEEVTPVPIPNTEVKLFSADGTAPSVGGRVGHRRNLLYPHGPSDCEGFFYVTDLIAVRDLLVPVKLGHHFAAGLTQRQTEFCRKFA